MVIGRIDEISVIRGDRYYFIPFQFFQETGFSPFGGSRYYFLPVILTSILWSLIIWSLLKTRRNFYKIATVLIIGVYLLYNRNLIAKETKATQPISERMKIYLSYVKEGSSRFSKDTTIVTPPDFIWASQMIRLFYGYPEMKFIPLKAGWESLVPSSDKQKLIILDFDYKTNKIIEK